MFEHTIRVLEHYIWINEHDIKHIPEAITDKDKYKAERYTSISEYNSAIKRLQSTPTRKEVREKVFKKDWEYQDNETGEYRYIISDEEAEEAVSAIMKLIEGK